MRQMRRGIINIEKRFPSSGSEFYRSVNAVAYRNYAQSVINTIDFSLGITDTSLRGGMSTWTSRFGNSEMFSSDLLIALGGTRVLVEQFKNYIDTLTKYLVTNSAVNEDRSANGIVIKTRSRITIVSIKLIVRDYLENLARDMKIDSLNPNHIDFTFYIMYFSYCELLCMFTQIFERIQGTNYHERRIELEKLLPITMKLPVYLRDIIQIWVNQLQELDYNSKIYDEDFGMTESEIEQKVGVATELENTVTRKEIREIFFNIIKEQFSSKISLDVIGIFESKSNITSRDLFRLFPGLDNKISQQLILIYNRCNFTFTSGANTSGLDYSGNIEFSEKLERLTEMNANNPDFIIVRKENLTKLSRDMDFGFLFNCFKYNGKLRFRCLENNNYGLASYLIYNTEIIVDDQLDGFINTTTMSKEFNDISLYNIMNNDKITRYISLFSLGLDHTYQLDFNIADYIDNTPRLKAFYEFEFPEVSAAFFSERNDFDKTKPYDNVVFNDENKNKNTIIEDKKDTENDPDKKLEIKDEINDKAKDSKDKVESGKSIDKSIIKDDLGVHYSFVNGKIKIRELGIISLTKFSAISNTNVDKQFELNVNVCMNLAKYEYENSYIDERHQESITAMIKFIDENFTEFLKYLDSIGIDFLAFKIHSHGGKSNLARNIIKKTKVLGKHIIDIDNIIKNDEIDKLKDEIPRNNDLIMEKEIKLMEDFGQKIKDNILLCHHHGQLKHFKSNYYLMLTVFVDDKLFKERLDERNDKMTEDTLKSIDSGRNIGINCIIMKKNFEINEIIITFLFYLIHSINIEED
jgi:hypothetical protein